MIAIKKLTDKLENTLNEISSMDVEYKLFTDTGKYKKATRKINTVKPLVNGLFSLVSANTEEANGLVVATLQSRVELVIPCRDDESDVYGYDESGEKTLIENGNETFISYVRNDLDSICEKNWSDTIDNFDVTGLYSLATSGNRTQLAGIGDCFTFTLYGYYTVVEGGDNSRNWRLYLDGEKVPFTNLTIRRVPSQEPLMISGATKTVCVGTSETLGISIQCPSIVNELCKTIKGYVLDGGLNDVHILTIGAGKDKDGNEITRFYFVVFGEVTATASGVLNVGENISFSEALPSFDIMTTHDKDYYCYKWNKSTAFVLKAEDFNNESDEVVVWGGESSSIYDASEVKILNSNTTLDSGYLGYAIYISSKVALKDDKLSEYGLTRITKTSGSSGSSSQSGGSSSSGGSVSF